jgi:hypothetical protein
VIVVVVVVQAAEGRLVTDRPTDCLYEYESTAGASRVGCFRKRRREEHAVARRTEQNCRRSRVLSIQRCLCSKDMSSKMDMQTSESRFN